MPVTKSIHWDNNYTLITKNSKSVAQKFYAAGFVGGKRFNHGIAMIDNKETFVQYNKDLQLTNHNNCITILE